MIQKIRQFVLIGLTSLALLTPGLLTPAFSGVAVADISDNLCTGAQAASDETSGCKATGGNVNQKLTGLAKKITMWFSIIVGAISIIMIIYGGFRYITSGGDSGRVGSAKNTLIYAVIGLIIVALAQLIVNFVITQSENAGTDFSSPG